MFEDFFVFSQFPFAFGGLLDSIAVRGEPGRLQAVSLSLSEITVIWLKTVDIVSTF